MKKYLVLLIYVIFLFSCSNKNQGNFTVIGKIDNAPENTKVTLLKVTPSELIPVDSTYIKKGQE
jgi:PBP1b-binding outer membrane lipoprotein LpoB